MPVGCGNMPPPAKRTKKGRRVTHHVGRTKTHKSRKNSDRRDQYKCVVCGKVTRSDHLIKHLTDTIMFDLEDKEGKRWPIDADNELYDCLTKKQKAHTDKCRNEQVNLI